MELWNKKQVEEQGKAFILNELKYINKEITNEENNEYIDNYFKAFHDEFNKKEIHRENAKKNMDNLRPYFLNADTLINLENYRVKAMKNFSDDNLTLIRIFDMIITAETTIKLEIEYNDLFDFIPEETKKQLPKKLQKPRDVQNSIDTLPSIEFVIKKNNGLFGEKVIKLLNRATYEFAKISWFLFVSDLICATFDIKDGNKSEFGTTNDEYIDAIKGIKKVFTFGKRVKDFEKTRVYKTLDNYTKLIDVLNNEDYKKEQKNLIPQLRKMILNGEDVDKLLEYINDNLMEQGWWYNDRK